MNLKELVDKLRKVNIEEGKSDTFKCPNCGTKVLKKTGYCVKCKKKVKAPDGEGEGDAS